MLPPVISNPTKFPHIPLSSSLLGDGSALFLRVPSSVLPPVLFTIPPPSFSRRSFSLREDKLSPDPLLNLSSLGSLTLSRDFSESDPPFASRFSSLSRSFSSRFLSRELGLSSSPLRSSLILGSLSLRDSFFSFFSFFSLDLLSLSLLLLLSLQGKW